MTYFRPSLVIFTLVIAASLLVGGCGVRQKVFVTTDPPGATVTMNGVSLGPTPVEQPFTWYWYYDFIAEKEGYQRVGTRERFRAPIYMIAGLDLLMEMMPFYVKDYKHVHLVLEPLEAKPDPQFAGMIETTRAAIEPEAKN